MDAIGLHFFDCFYQCSLVLKKNGTPFYSDRDRKILTKTYGLASSEIHTFTEIAQEFGLSRERIRQLHVKIFKRMGFLRRNKYPATVKIDKLISKNYSISIEHDEQFALYIEQFHKEHMPEFSLYLFLRLLSFYLYRHSGYVNKWDTIICQNNKREQTAQRKILKLSTRLEEFVKKILWFDNTRIWTKEDMRQFIPTRHYNMDELDKPSTQGEFWSEKLNRHVFYESLLEKHFYDFLEKCPEVIHYTEQSINVPYFIRQKICYYTPDVTVFLSDGRCFVVEIKDSSGMVERKVQNKFKALIEYCKLNGMGVILTDGYNDFSKILTHESNTEFENALKDRIEYNSSKIFYPEFKIIVTKYNASNMDIQKAIVHLNLAFYRTPFMIQKCKKPIFCEELMSLMDTKPEIVNS